MHPFQPIQSFNTSFFNQPKQLMHPTNQSKHLMHPTNQSKFLMLPFQPTETFNAPILLHV